MKKTCPETKIFNPITGRCVDKNGKIGRALLKSRTTQTIKSKEKEHVESSNESPRKLHKTTIVNKIKKLWLARKIMLDRWQREQTQYIGNLERKEKALINNYINPESTIIPMVMAGSCIKDDGCVLTEDASNKFKMLMHIIENAPPLPCDINVYRQTFRDVSKICHDNPDNKCIYHPYLASTTLVLQKADEFKKQGDVSYVDKYYDGEGEIKYRVVSRSGVVYRMKLNKGYKCLLLGLLNPTSKQYLIKPSDGIEWWDDQQYEILIGPFIATKQNLKNTNNKVIPFTIVKSQIDLQQCHTMIKITPEYTNNNNKNKNNNNNNHNHNNHNNKNKSRL